MADVVEILRTLLIVLWALFLYELLRFLVKNLIKKRFERDLRRFLQTPDLYHQRFKFTNKLIIRNQLLSDPEINEKIIEHSRRHDEPIDAVRARVEGYIEEIVPSFNMLSYYKLGYTVARAFIHLVYSPVVDRERRRVLEALPKDASPVYVINHRSNVDFVLLAYILAGKVSVSYAVGEWARVWPLEHLFKSFGSYLIRRGYKQELYHTVLRRYVQLTTRHGVAQAFFPEGRLTRDGYLLDPKLGLLNWYAGVEAEPGFDQGVVLIPVGINYDWVLEDENLVREAEGRRREKKGIAKKIGVILVGPFIFIGLLVVNGIRRLAGRLKLHGYASLSFGEPLVVRDFMHARGVPFDTLGYEERKQHIGPLAEEMMRRLGAAVPATPVAMLAVTLLENDLRPFTRAEAAAWVAGLSRRLEQANAPFVRGEEFKEIREALDKEETERPKGEELRSIERGLARQEEAEQVVRLAVDIMRRSKLLVRDGDRYTVRTGAENRLRYYANSIAHHLDVRFDVTQAQEAPAEASRSGSAGSS